MKKIFSGKKVIQLVTVLSIFTVVIYTACKKSHGPGEQTAASLLEPAKSWYENTIVQNELLHSTDTGVLKKGVLRKPGRMKNLGSILKWNESREYTDNGTSFMVTPMDEDIKPFANKEYEAGRCLIFYRDAAGNMQMRIMEMIGQKGTPINGTVLEIASAAFKNFNSGKNFSLGNTNAGIIFYNRDYGFEKGFAINEKPVSKTQFRLQNTQQAASRPSLSTMGKRETEDGACVMHYLVGYHYDPSNGQVVDYAILATWAECPNGVTNPPYGGDGTGVGTAPPPPPCMNDAGVSLGQMANNSFVTNDLQNMATLFQDGSTKTITTDWVVLKNTTWYLFSTETLVLERSSSDDPKLYWKFKSLTNNGLSKVGIVIGLGVDYKVTAAAASLGMYTANMDLKFAVKYSIVCSGFPISVEYSYHTNRNFFANE